MAVQFLARLIGSGLGGAQAATPRNIVLGQSCMAVGSRERSEIMLGTHNDNEKRSQASYRRIKEAQLPRMVHRSGCPNPVGESPHRTRFS